MNRFFLTTIALIWAVPVLAQNPTPTPEHLEFFEKKVRPVLVQHCYECHSADAKKLKGGLRVDSRAGLLEGGDNGPAVVPGQPEKSRLIEAIRYTNVDLKMPRTGKLSDAVIADLTAWVKQGAPWPAEKPVKKTTGSEFNLAQRKKEHWSWQPIRVPEVPKVQDAGWARSDIDRFLLAKLEAKGLKPAVDADPRTLLRRLYLDLIGLPPARDDVEEFVKAWGDANAQRDPAIEKVVDRLLESPQFGERWARHWLDLVRYAESRGHEFDYTIPNAYQYRDYVIRAINADVPYNQFVQEHLAGDLLKSPRLHPKEHYNESILGTGFWFLGEEVHSPVDIRQDQADRFDNRIDVMTKTFLGLTVACARCHDHKFDAISTKDYYALFGVLESSNYRLARFDTIAHNRKVAEGLAELRDKSRPNMQKAFATAAAPSVLFSDVYLLTAAGVQDRAKELNPILLKRWQQELAKAVKDEASPLHPFAKASANQKLAVRDLVQPILKQMEVADKGAQALQEYLARAAVVVDYRAGTGKDWLPDDSAFGVRPERRGDLVLGESPQRPIARIAEDGAAASDRHWAGLRLVAGSQNESGSLGGAMRPGRTLRTPEFTLSQGKAYALVKGSGMIYAGVGQHIMLAGPLHGRLVQKFNTGNQFQWVTVDLAPYKGQRAHLEFTPQGTADFALAIVVQGAEPPPARPATTYFRGLSRDLGKAVNLDSLAAVYQQSFTKALAAFAADGVANDPAAASLANWFVQNADLFIAADSKEAQDLAKIAGPILEQQKALLAQIKLDSRLAPAMQDGSGTDEHVFTRGNPKTPGSLVPRRFLEALTGPDALPVKTGSGRLELVELMTDPARNPYITRVYVNRVWHHLFGRGIVATVDNFGVLGEAPTHPELLDYLAHQFAASRGANGAIPEGGGMAWSTKKLIRALVLTRAYRMSSVPDAQGDQADPQNLLLHRMRLRRLEGEAIRDSILRVSGRLNLAMHGPSVPVFLTAFQDGRGKPGNGPLDGDGRRSVYLSVRRNFLSSFLLAFDTPSPFSTVGRRTVSNVPAQALILMNDPFVHNQAEVWAKRVVAEKGSDTDRVRGMYLDAFSRPPTEAELRACSEYLGAAPDVRRWADLAHVLFNTKEFFFVN